MKVARQSLLLLTNENIVPYVWKTVIQFGFEVLLNNFHTLLIWVHDFPGYLAIVNTFLPNWDCSKFFPSSMGKETFRQTKPCSLDLIWKWDFFLNGKQYDEYRSFLYCGKLPNMIKKCQCFPLYVIRWHILTVV